MKILIAECVFEILNSTNELQEYFKDFLYSGKQDADLAIQYQKDAEKSEYEKVVDIFFEITTYLINKKCVRIHSSCIKVGEDAIGFLAPSGTGKSTHTRLWQKYCEKQVVVVNDDQTYYKLKNDGIYAFSSPLAGKHKKYANVSAKLKAFVVLKQGVENKFYKLDKLTSTKLIYKQLFLPGDKSGYEKTFEIFEKILELIPIYFLECDISQNAFKTCYSGIFGE